MLSVSEIAFIFERGLNRVHSYFCRKSMRSLTSLGISKCAADSRKQGHESSLLMRVSFREDRFEAAPCGLTGDPQTLGRTREVVARAQDAGEMNLCCRQSKYAEDLVRKARPP